MLNIKLCLILSIVSAAETASSSDGGSVRDTAFISDPKTVTQEWDRIEKETKEKYSKLFQAENNEFEALRLDLEKIWKDKIFSDRKVYVHYSEDKRTRIIVDYEESEVRAESLDSKPQKHIKEIIMEVIGTKATETSVAPILYNEDLENIKITSIDREIAKKANQTKVVIGKVRKFQVVIKMTPDWRRRREKLYLPIITKWADEYNIDPAFVMAVIRAESAFNPNAMSPVGAIGLMQIMPQYAGREVANRLGQPELSSPRFLYDPNVNIQIGVYYLKLLREEYFSAAVSNSSHQLLMTASYNWGPDNLKRAMIRRNIKIESVPSAIENFVMNYSPNETQEYIKRVMTYYREYSGQSISIHTSKEVCFENG